MVNAAQNIFQISQVSLQINNLKFYQVSSVSDYLISSFQVNMTFNVIKIIDSYPGFLILHNSSIILNNSFFINNNQSLTQRNRLKLFFKTNSEFIYIQNTLFYNMFDEKNGGVINKQNLIIFLFFLRYCIFQHLKPTKPCYYKIFFFAIP